MPHPKSEAFFNGRLVIADLVHKRYAFDAINKPRRGGRVVEGAALEKP